MNDEPRPDVDRAIDDALRRRFAPPSDLGHLLARPDGAPRRPRRMPWPLLLAAAALVVVSLWAWSQRRAAATPHDLPALWVNAYHAAIAAGFEAPSCCDAGGDLPAHCRELFAAAVAVSDDAGLDLCGSYCGGPTGGAVSLLGRYHDQPVCLFVLPRSSAPAITVVQREGVTIRRRDVGELAVFEVSSLAEARALPHLYVPEG